MTQNGSKWPKNDIYEMSRFTRFARHKFSAARHLKLFCTPVMDSSTPPPKVIKSYTEKGNFITANSALTKVTEKTA